MINKKKIVGIFLITIGISLPIFIFSKNKVSNIIYETKIEKRIATKEYFAILEIPKIKLKRELYSIEDARNDVELNVLVHKNSIFPTFLSNKSNVILAAHSGSGNNAYFKNLYKLDINDKIKLYYNHVIYEYEIKEIEYQNKTGELYLKQEYNDTLTLITCTYNDKNTQTIYYASLKNIINIS